MNCLTWKSCAGAICQGRDRLRPLKRDSPARSPGEAPASDSRRNNRASVKGLVMRATARDDCPRWRARARSLVNCVRCSIHLAIACALVSTSARAAEISASDCARAAKYSESKGGAGMLVIQNGRTIFEHYANGGAAERRWPIFSGTKSFWGIAALAAVRDGLFKLDDPVSDTITEWKSDPRKSQISIRQLLNQTDGIEGASRLQRPTIRDRNAMAIRLPVLAAPARLSFMDRAISRFLSSSCIGNCAAATRSNTLKATWPGGWD